YYTLGDGVTPTGSVELDERNSINPWPSDHRAVLSTFTLTPPQPVAKASLPSPANLATNVSQNPALIWLSGSNATGHSVYLGVGSPSMLIASTTNNSLTLTNLLPNTIYSWRVDESTPAGTVGGDVWLFTTKA